MGCVEGVGDVLGLLGMASRSFMSVTCAEVESLRGEAAMAYAPTGAPGTAGGVGAAGRLGVALVGQT
jgi:hypothetical protein